MKQFRKMPIDFDVLREKVKADKAEIERLRGLIEFNQQKAVKDERNKSIWLAIARQYQNEIDWLKENIQRNEEKIGGRGGY